MSADQSSPPPAIRVTAAKCARCGQAVQARYRPFCSQRCAEIDLGSWFTERYRVATDETPADAPPKGEEDTYPPTPNPISRKSP